MNAQYRIKTHQHPTHSWLKELRLSYLPASSTPLLEDFSRHLLATFEEHSHAVLPIPQGHVDVLLTTAHFGEPVNWREAVLFTAKRRYGLENVPTVFTLVHGSPKDVETVLGQLTSALVKEVPDPSDYGYPGLAPMAYHTLHEQGRRGGPLMALVRLIQAQVLSARGILVIGEEMPQEAYTFDLVGAHPRSLAQDEETFYLDLMQRIVTAASTFEITDHQEVGEPLSRAVWQRLSTPAAMLAGSRELGKRHFFTEMVRVANLVNVPLLDAAVSSQYSEGCFATWEPALDALIATVTGSARPVEKDRLTTDELAVITGVRLDGRGALVRRVEGLRNSPPSSEAVEMIAMDASLPRIRLGTNGNRSGEVPVARSKLHGHRGVKSYDPNYVEYAPLEPAYYSYPVSCATDAQATAIRRAFSRAQALRHPQDGRKVVFTVLPGHGAMLVEKWVPGKAPFQIIWEYMDAGILEIDNHVPQGALSYAIRDGRAILSEEGPFSG
jgi:hypothetical protein